MSGEHPDSDPRNSGIGTLIALLIFLLLFGGATGTTIYVWYRQSRAATMEALMAADEAMAARRAAEAAMEQASRSALAAEASEAERRRLSDEREANALVIRISPQGEYFIGEAVADAAELTKQLEASRTQGRDVSFIDHPEAPVERLAELVRLARQAKVRGFHVSTPDSPPPAAPK